MEILICRKVQENTELVIIAETLKTIIKHPLGVRKLTEQLQISYMLLIKVQLGQYLRLVLWHWE